MFWGAGDALLGVAATRGIVAAQLARAGLLGSTLSRMASPRILYCLWHMSDDELSRSGARPELTRSPDRVRSERVLEHVLRSRDQNIPRTRVIWG